MSLRPPLHVSTFHSRTVVSMFGRLCHLFVHALSSLQVANAQCMTLRSLAPCLRAAREKHRFAAGKNIGTEKNTFGSRKKTPCSGKKLFPQREKMPAKNAASQREKFKAAEKTPCSKIGHFVRGLRTVLWEVPKDLMAAIEDVVVFLNYLQKCHRELSQGGTAQLLVMCNRTAVHNQLLQHGFQAAWSGGLRIATTSSAAGPTARIAVVVETGCGFLSGGRRGASLEDKEDCFGRATVALTRAIRHTYIVSPIDMAGMIGMAQTLAVYHYGYHTSKTD